MRIEKNRVINETEAVGTKDRAVKQIEFVGTVRDAHWETGDGRTLTETKSPMLLLFGLGDPIEEVEDDGQFVTWIFEIPAEISFMSYQALRAAMTMDPQLEHANFPWAEMLQSGKFPVKYARIEAANEDGDFFKYTGTTRPKEIPSFLR